MSAKQKRKIRVAEINPAGTKLDALNDLPCFLGLSVDSLASTGVEYLQHFLPWAIQRFSSVHIVLGDLMHRLNINPDGAPEDPELIPQAIRDCQIFYDKVTQIVQSSEANDITIFRTTDLSHDSVFAACLAQTLASYKTDRVLAALVDRDVDRFIKRRERRGEACSSKKRLKQNSVRYILEELAVFAVLKNELGDCVHLYLGTHSDTVKSVVCGEVPSLATLLEGQPCVDLYLSSAK